MPPTASMLVLVIIGALSAWSVAGQVASPSLTAPSPAPVAVPPTQGAPQATPAAAAQCPVAVQYNVNLGQGNDTAVVPIFVATVTIQNNDPTVEIQGWRMGWHFPYGSTIKTPQDVFDPGVRLLTPDSSSAVLDSAPGRNTSVLIPSRGGSRQFGFLGTKSSLPLNSSNPYNVGAVTGMAFNNLLCSMVTAPPPAVQGGSMAVPNAAGVGAVLNPTHIEIQYTPIEYIGQPIESTYTQLLIRVSNIQNASTLDLSRVGLQYWFEGPDNPLPALIDGAPWDYFTGRCDWATTGCAGVILGISRGYPDVFGARFALNITFNSSAGTLLPTGAGAVPALFLGEGLDVMDILLTITTKSGVALLNATEDYSFLDTPILQQAINASGNVTGGGGGAASNGGSNSTIVPRRAEPNTHIPAYLDGNLVWGVLPTPQLGGPPAMEPGAESLGHPFGLTGMGGSGTNGSPNSLPDGVACQTAPNGGQQSCSLQAIYCCTSPDPANPSVTPVAPVNWPPRTSVAGAIAPGTEGILLPGTAPGQEIIVPSFPPVPSPSSGDLSGGQVGAQPSPPPATTGGGSVAWVAGIAVGLVVGGVVAAGAFIAWRRRRRKALGVANGWDDKDDPLPVNETHSSNDSQSNARGAPPLDSREKQLPWVTPLAARFATDGSGASPRSQSSLAGSNRPLLAAGARRHGDSASLGTSPTYTLAVAANRYGSTPGTSPSSNAVRAAPGPLFKYPSGVSGTSLETDPSAVLDTFSSDGGTRTLPASPFAGMLGPYTNGSTAPGVQNHDDDGPRPLPSNVLLLLERKARTAPALISRNPSRKRMGNMRRRLQRRLTRGADIVENAERDDREEESSDAGVDDGDDTASEGAADLGSIDRDRAPWQLRRSASWDGTLHDPRAADSWSHVERLKRRRTMSMLPAPLPPLAPMPQPLHPGAGPAPDVDLDVDWAELEGHLGRCLGTGGFGTVFEATWRGRKVAVKMLPPMPAVDAHGGGAGQAAYEALLREIQLASKFNCDRLVKVYGACTRDRDRCCLIMELLQAGSLFERIYDKHKRRLGYLDILQLAHDIAEGLAYLHPSVVHRDLKPQNVLLDKEGRAKLADFGISRVKDPTKSYFTQVTSENGTPCYMAPEMMNGMRIDEKVDVYALGCIINEAWTRRQPWRDSVHFFQIVLRVAVNGERPWVDPDCPEPLKKLIMKCWHQDPRQRPSCADVMRLTDLLMQEEMRRWERPPPG